MAVEQFKQSVFNAIKLDNVIWVDDRFSPKNNSIVDDYLSSVEVFAQANPEAISNFEHIVNKNIDISEPFEIWKEYLPTEDHVISDYYSHIGQSKPDFTTTEFNGLIDIFDQYSIGKLEKLSLSEWNEKKSNWLTSNSRNLFLIDYNFEHEGASKTFGKEIIEEILNQTQLSDIYCVLFTSEAKHGLEEEAKRNEIIKELNSSLDTYNFSVLSKDIISVEDKSDDVCLDFKASEFIKRIFLRKLSAEMVGSLSEELVKSIQELRNDLSQNSIYEIDHSIFSSSLKEGASEIELLNRLFSIKQNKSIGEFFKTSSPLINKLADFRSVQAVVFNEDKYKSYLDKIIPANTHFSSLRKDEIFDFSINRIHSPLSSGDIFEFESKKYILIEQACDLLVRGSTGSRKLTEATLIPFTEREIKQGNNKQKVSFYQKESESKYHMLQVPNAESTNYYYLFNFSEAITVNINWLDLCVYNSDGSLRVEYRQSPSKLVHLPGWIKRYNNLMEKLSQVHHASHYHAIAPKPPLQEGDYQALLEEFSTFSLAKLSWLKTSVSRSSLSMAGKRVARLREGFTESVCKAYYIGYKARGALGNDFSS
ncbi:hypothetical protein ACOMICROBIO_LMKGKHOH_01008 [Vibrio sp. B1FIG11]|uniref:hypothetical protein n=1 Tax=Vibrio sp. B1FIG11 TaxID=2751177 RepID=UPI001AFC2B5A|nr:hypothetical protein [Vibrio sp. B1FIG11]CAD7798847.1 hypothetical protein ACOMICROBIO_LMKGKHOH_01008 [Vibrio sp. B1FIG11]CAE6883608.1 hypothetical protein ACOMICROBIO_LMKGKHOH_01008 [Vibrio sp. B1FIG11]